MVDKLKQRILDISKELGLSHIGSNISALPVYVEIYQQKRPDDIVIADNAHSHLAHLVVKESYVPATGIIDAPYEDITEAKDLIEKHGIHCDRKAGCDASGGSLGHGLGIGIGYALADRSRDVYVILSEGSCMEGSTWEALQTITRLKIMNIKIYTNFNGYSAVGEVDRERMAEKVSLFARYLKIEHRFTDNGEGFEGVAGHYRKVTDE